MPIVFLFDDARARAAMRTLGGDATAYRSVPPASPDATPPDAVILPIPLTRDGVTVSPPLSIPLPMLAQRLSLWAKTAKIIGYGTKPAVFDGLDYRNLAKDAAFIRRNAQLTADGAMMLLLTELTERGGLSLSDCFCVIIGYGRIAREVAARLASFGARILVGARRQEARAAAADAGYLTYDTADTDFFAGRGRYMYQNVPHILINTAPATSPLTAATAMPSPLFLLELSGVASVWEATRTLPYPAVNGSSLPLRITPGAAGAALAAAISRICADTSHTPLID